MQSSANSVTAPTVVAEIVFTPTPSSTPTPLSTATETPLPTPTGTLVVLPTSTNTPNPVSPDGLDEAGLRDQPNQDNQNTSPAELPSPVEGQPLPQEPVSEGIPNSGGVLTTNQLSLVVGGVGILALLVVGLIYGSHHTSFSR